MLRLTGGDVHLFLTKSVFERNKTEKKFLLSLKKKQNILLEYFKNFVEENKKEYILTIFDRYAL